MPYLPILSTFITSTPSGLQFRAATELYRMSPRDTGYKERIVEWSKANRTELEGIYTGPATRRFANILKIWMDVLKNYDVDGIHFDYVRLASPDFDYSRTSLNRFQWLNQNFQRPSAVSSGGT